MSEEENKTIVRRIIEELNNGNMAVVDELFATDCVGHWLGGDIRASEAFKRAWITGLAAFPDFRFTIEDMIAEGDKVLVRITVSGTHKGEFMGIAPTGKQVTWTRMAFYRLAGGKIVENWLDQDRLSLIQQLSAR